MLPVIKKKLDALRTFKHNADRIVIEVAKLYQKEIINFNTEQLGEGEQTTGLPIVPKYTPYTIRIKRSKGQPTSRVTLYDEGDFYDSFFISFGGTYFEINAKDWKAGELERKYGSDIYGLSREHLDTFIEVIRPVFLQTFKNLVL